ncbi:MAG: hypothetical protein H0V66_14915, partial [Bdellovibrionales bacterium]|nr:hypothetical protein [Bdellovibrionales bacterium]
MKTNVLILGLILGFISATSFAACPTLVKLSKLKTVKAFVCADETISFAQPSNTTYEGLCGPTAAANSFYAYCKNSVVDPRQISLRYFTDITPGVRPDVL